MTRKTSAGFLWLIWLVIGIGGAALPASAVVWTDDFTGGLNLPWVFLDDLGNSPPPLTDISFNDADQDLKFLGSATTYDQDFELSLSTTGYVGLGDSTYEFPNEVHVTATFGSLKNLTLGFEESVVSNNDAYVVARGNGLNGYVFALDAINAAADLVRVDEGAVVGLGETAILRGLEGVDPNGTYTLRLSAIDTTLTGQVFDAQMNLLGEVQVDDGTYETGWAGLGSAINDDGDDLGKTLIATRFDNFTASDTLDDNVETPSIDELTAAVRSGLTDTRFDIDQNGVVNADDRVAWVVSVANTFFGDANLDGQFNSADFVFVFTTGEYEDAIADNSLWGDGDWNGDGDFSSSDFVLAFTGGSYEAGPRTALVVPEPAALSLILSGGLASIGVRRCFTACRLSRS